MSQLCVIQRYRRYEQSLIENGMHLSLFEAGNRGSAASRLGLRTFGHEGVRRGGHLGAVPNLELGNSDAILAYLCAILLFRVKIVIIFVCAFGS